MNVLIYLLCFPLASSFSVYPALKYNTLPSTHLFGAPKFGVVANDADWLERSSPDAEPKDVEEYDVGMSGITWEVGPETQLLYDQMNVPKAPGVAGALAAGRLMRTLKLYALEFTAKEAVKAALCKEGLERVPREDEEDTGVWADIGSIQLLNEETKERVGKVYDSLEDVVEEWQPGQPFAFVAKKVLAKKVT